MGFATISYLVFGVFLTAFALASVVSPLIIEVATRRGLVDLPSGVPSGRKMHRLAVPRLGGLAIVAGFAGSLVLALLVPGTLELVQNNAVYLRTLLGGGALVLAVGIYDDVRGLNAPWKFLVQFAAAVVVTGGGYFFSSLSFPFFGAVDLGIFSIPLSILWVMGVINAMNLIDGLDGLAAGVAAIVCATVGAIALTRNDYENLFLATALAGSALGFLRFNRTPARLFMGDTGSMFLGFILAVISMKGSIKGSTAAAIAIPILALGVPVIDTLFVMWARFWDPGQKSFYGKVLRMFRADRSHLHHLLLEGSRNHRTAVWTIYLTCVMFAAGAYLLALQSSAVLGVILVASAVAAIALLRHFGPRRLSVVVSESEADESRDPGLAVKGQNA